MYYLFKKIMNLFFYDREERKPPILKRTESSIPTLVFELDDESDEDTILADY
jgi:hypothetical protein